VAEVTSGWFWLIVGWLLLPVVAIIVAWSWLTDAEYRRACATVGSGPGKPDQPL
jgi:hypothetical protein